MCTVCAVICWLRQVIARPKTGYAHPPRLHRVISFNCVCLCVCVCADIIQVRAIKHQTKERPLGSTNLCEGYLARLDGSTWKRQYLVLSAPVLTAYSSIKAVVVPRAPVRHATPCLDLTSNVNRRNQTNLKFQFR